MTEDIIRMARDAGFTIEGPFIFSDDPDNNIKKELARFAALVRAAEREACAQVLEMFAPMVIEKTAAHDFLIASAAAIRARSKG